MKRCRECGKLIWSFRPYDGHDFRLKETRPTNYYWHAGCYYKMHCEWSDEYQRQQRERYGVAEYHRDPVLSSKQLDEFMRHH